MSEYEDDVEVYVSEKDKKKGVVKNDNGQGERVSRVKRARGVENVEYEYQEEPAPAPAPPKPKTVNKPRMAVASAPVHNVRTVRKLVSVPVEVKKMTTESEVDKLRKKIKLYSYGIVFMTGLVAGIVIGVML